MLEFDELAARLDRIETTLSELVGQLVSLTKYDKEFYTTADVAEILDRAEFTVREWCRLGRVHASKRLNGRGTSKEWVISREELGRIQKEGLLPVKSFSCGRVR